MPVVERDRKTNRLLTLLSDDEYERLRPHLTNVNLEYKKILYEASVRLSTSISPIDSVASLVLTIVDGSTVEVGTIGNEGIAGLPVILGDQYAPSGVYVQVPGTALKIDANAFRTRLAQSPTLKVIGLRYIHLLQSGGANRRPARTFTTSNSVGADGCS
jgi:hypothetical protein